jgi:hypothetical protein
MAATSPDNISYPVNTDAQKSIEDRIYDTAASVQTALDTKANLAGARFTSSGSGSTPLIARGASGQTANLQEWQDSSASVIGNIDASGRLTLPNQPVYGGSITGVASSNFYPTTVDNFVVGFSKSGNNRLTAQVAGKYYVYAQQLINTSSSLYFHILKNGISVAYAYANADDTYDVIVGALVSLAVNDYIELYYGTNVSYAWPAPHSSYAVFKVS